jgi:hypothetical protein
VGADVAAGELCADEGGGPREDRPGGELCIRGEPFELHGHAGDFGDDTGAVSVYGEAGIVSRAGHIAVPRDNPREAIKAMIEAGKMLKERGISVLIFPEGGRSERVKLQPFKEGAFYIAINSGVPVVPVALAGTEKVLPMGSGTVRPGEVRLRIGDPISTVGMTMKDRGKLTQQAFEGVYGLLEGTDLVEPRVEADASV